MGKVFLKALFVLRNQVLYCLICFFKISLFDACVFFDSIKVSGLSVAFNIYIYVFICVYGKYIALYINHRKVKLLD